MRGSSNERGDDLVTRSTGLGLALVLGCLPRQSGEQREVAPAPDEGEAEAALACAPSSDRAVALLPPSAGGEHPCGLIVEQGEGGSLGVRVRAQVGEADTPVFAEGLAPEPCGAELELCELWGVAAAVGPVLVAAVRGPESEMPTQVLLGLVEGSRLAFVETWYGLPSVVDHTRVGPPWALGAYECGGELLLLPMARLPEAELEAPEPTLTRLAGKWSIDEAGLAQPPAVAAEVEVSSCRRVVDGLP